MYQTHDWNDEKHGEEAEEVHVPPILGEEIFLSSRYIVLKTAHRWHEECI